jgi:hypothetical protein
MPQHHPIRCIPMSSPERGRRHSRSQCHSSRSRHHHRPQHHPIRCIRVSSPERGRRHSRSQCHSLLSSRRGQYREGAQRDDRGQRPHQSQSHHRQFSRTYRLLFYQAHGAGRRYSPKVAARSGQSRAARFPGPNSLVRQPRRQPRSQRQHHPPFQAGVQHWKGNPTGTNFLYPKVTEDLMEQ